MGPHTIIILKEMCKMVGADFDSIDFKEDHWFHKHTWTKHWQNRFIDIMTDYLYTNIAARRELMMWPRRAKKHCRKVAEYFNMNYGWKLTDTEGGDA